MHTTATTRGRKRIRKLLSALHSSKCHYCHKEQAYDLLTIDHKFPKSLGGEDELENLVLCCSTCNQLKAHIPYHQFIKDIEFFTIDGLIERKQALCRLTRKASRARSRFRRKQKQRQTKQLALVA